jgi:hypothetical protein
MMRLTVLIVAALISACGEVTPDGANATPLGRSVTPSDPPPDVLLDGVPGHPVSYCWQNRCVDGGLDVEAGYPPVEPAAGTVTVGSPGVVAEVRVANPGVADSQRVPVDGTRIGDLPPGDWPILTVFVRYWGGGDALYAWRIEDRGRPASSGSS